MIVWQRNPWRDQPRGTLLATLLITALLTTIARFSDTLAIPSTALAVLLLLAGGSLGPAYWPSAFRVDAGGISARQPFLWRHLRWEDIRRASWTRGGRGLGGARTGLFVSTLAQPGPLDAFRGMHLEIPSDAGRDALVADLTRRLSAHGL